MDDDDVNHNAYGEQLVTTLVNLRRLEIGTRGEATSDVPNRCKRLAFMLSLAVWLNLVCYLPELGQLIGRTLSVDVLYGIPWRIVRELVIWSCGSYAGLLWRRNACEEDSRGHVLLPPIAFLSLVYVMVLVLRTLMLGQGFIPVSAGLRVLPLIGLTLAVSSMKREDLAYFIGYFSMMLAYFAGIQFLFTIWELGFADGRFGVTFLGPRVSGTFSAPNNMGVAMLAIMMLLICLKTRYRWYVIPVCVFCILASGNRSAALGAIFLGLCVMASRVRYRIVLILPGLFLGVLAYQVVSSQAVSGRQISGEGRTRTWMMALSVMDGFWDWTLGHSLGSLMNVTVSTAASGKALIADSMFVTVLGSYGIVGFLLLAIWVVFAWRRASIATQLIVLPAIFVVACSFNIIELPVLNLVFSCLTGFAMAQKKLGAELDRADGQSIGRAAGMSLNQTLVQRMARVPRVSAVAGS